MPYLPESREYRNFAASCFRAVQAEESDERSYVVRGHYTVFESEYEVWPGYFEVIDSHALDETDMSDVLFQFNHSGTPLARLRNGSLKLGVDEKGGWAEADLSGCQQGRDIYEAISNGLIDRMSFGFTVPKDGYEWSEDEDGNVHSRITKVEKLYDVACVDLPASDYTDISARSQMAAGIEAQRRQADENAKAEEELAEQERKATETAALRRRKAKALELKGLQYGYAPE